MTERQTGNPIDKLAADWVARCDRGPLSQAEQQRLDAWLEADPRHRGAFARASVLFTRFDQARALGANYDPKRYAARNPGPRNPHRRRFLRWAGAGAAASLAAGMAGMAILGTQPKRYATRLGEVLRVLLDDGSSVTLNSETLLEVDFSSTRRLLRLVNGEALFEVAHDAMRPFVVRAARASIVATGTRFSVQLASAAVEVLVSEGSVELEAGLASLAPVALGANMMATAAPDLDISTQRLPPVEIRRRLAWRQGMLSFDGDTLADAAAQFARYSHKHIIIHDPQIAQRRVVGRYSANDPAGFARSVALSMNLHVRQDGNRILIGPPANR